MGLISKFKTALYLFSNVGLTTTKWSFVRKGGDIR